MSGNSVHFYLRMRCTKKQIKNSALCARATFVNLVLLYGGLVGFSLLGDPHLLYLLSFFF